MKKHLNALIILLAKSGKLLKVVKSTKVLKMLFSFITMAISTACYSTSMGWFFALGFIILLFLHEIGHVVALKNKGYESSVPVFIPFLGAVIFSPKFNNKEEEAYVGFGGPFLGTISSLLVMIPYFITGSTFWVSLSLLGIFLNLFNMIPLSPLDGGRITQVISDHFKWVGVSLLFLFTIILKDPGMLLIWIIVFSDSETLPIRTKRIGMILSLLTMVTLIVIGWTNEQVKSVHIVDIILGTIFCLGTIYILLTNKPLDYEFQIQKEIRLQREINDKLVSCLEPENGFDHMKRVECVIPKQTKLLWFALWSSLIIIQVITLIIQGHILYRIH